MSLFSRNFKITAIVLILILGGIMLGARAIILKSYIAIEESEAREHIERFSSLFEHGNSLLDNTCSDYATDDGAYNFVLNRNPDFIRLNLADSTLSKVKLDFISIILLDGEEVFSKIVEGHKGPFAPYSALKPYLFDSNALLNISGTKGLIMVNKTPVIVSSKPILTSEGKGPVTAMMIVGRILDEQEIKHIAELVRLPVEMTPYTAVRGKSRSDSIIKVSRPDFNSLKTSMILNDINSSPALKATATMERTIYKQGADTVRTFMFSMFGLALIALYTLNRLTGRLGSSEWDFAITETLCNAVVEKSPTATLLMDAETCRIIKTTPEASILLGYSPERLNGVLFRELLHESQDEFEKCRVESFDRGASFSPAELKLARSDRNIISAAAEINFRMKNGKRLIILHLQKSEKTG